MAIRPPRFHGFIGHTKLLDPVRRVLAGAMARGEPLPHMMLTGPSGVGKTELARALAVESEKKLVQVLGNAHRDVLIRKLRSLRPGDLLLIDEAHRLKPAEQEFLFEVVDKLRVSWPAQSPTKDRGNGVSKGLAKTPRTKRRRLPPFTLVLATDRPSHLVNALQKRIPTRLHLTLYRLAEMKEIVELIAARERVLLSPHAARRIAAASHGLPRRAKHLLVGLRLFAPVSRLQISVGDVADYLRAHGIDRDGLGREQRKYMRFLSGGGTASLDTLAQFLGTDRDDVLFQVEPPLVRMKLLVVTAKGRQLTEKGRTRIARLTRRRNVAVLASSNEEEE